MSVHLIAGLGNPGPEYHETRHNAGFMVLDRLADRADISVTRKAFSGLCGEGRWQEDRLFLLKPQTFMNLSGRSVAAALRYYKLTPAELIVIHDELDIPFGQVKIKEGGGHGGHNGLRSLMAELGSGDFLRFRVGIGRPTKGDPVKYVLGAFGKDEHPHLPRLCDGVCDLLGLLLREGVPKAMSLYNRKDLTLEP
jgi:peptidyl-tRNA hydrolase, PTH1 family